MRIYLILTLVFIQLGCRLYSQTELASNDYLTFTSDSKITEKGFGYYSCRLENISEKPVRVTNSRYDIKFKLFDPKGRERSRERDIEIQDVFINSNSSAFIEETVRPSLLDPSGTKFEEIESESGSIGAVTELYFDIPEGYISKYKLEVGQRVMFGQKNGVNFYVRLDVLERFLTKQWAGFKKYKIDIICHNTKNVKDENKYNVDFYMMFCGVEYSGNVSTKNLKAGQEFIKTEEYNFRSNVEPVVYFKNAGSSDVDPPKKYTSEYVNELKSKGGTIYDWINYRVAAAWEGSIPQVEEIREYTHLKFNNTSIVQFEKGYSLKENNKTKSLQHFKKAAELSIGKDNRVYYQSVYYCGIVLSQIGDSLWTQKNYLEADKDYKQAYDYIKKAGPINEKDISKAEYETNKTAIGKLTSKYANEQVKIKAEKEANKATYSNHVKDADLAMKNNDYSLAITKYEAAIALDINSKIIEPKLKLAKSKNEQKLKTEAALKEKKDKFDEHLSIAETKLNTKDFKGAHAEYELAKKNGYNTKLVNEKINSANEIEKNYNEYAKRFSFFTAPGTKVGYPIFAGYSTVEIAGQQWMVGGLRERLAGGGGYISVIDKIWHFSKMGKVRMKDASPGYYKPEKASIDTTVGFLYNNLAVTIKEGLCPKGWHVPSISDWKKLLTNTGAVITTTTSTFTKFNLDVKGFYGYDKDFLKASINKNSGLNINASNLAVMFGKENTFGSKFWAVDEDQKLWYVRFVQEKESVTIAIEKLYDVDQAAFECKCIKD